jgi:hypothetical protein
MAFNFNPFTGTFDNTQSIGFLDSRYVNVTGDTMTGDLNLSDASITNADQVSFNVLYTKTGSEPSGSIYWNTVDGTFDMKLNGATLQAGQELYFYGKATENITNGSLCQFGGVEGDHIRIKKCVPSEIIANPTYLIGVATTNISNGEFGYITWFGKVNDIYTKTPANNDSADWVEGDILYFNNSTGQLTKTAPTAPDRRIEVAAVIKQQTGASETGIIIVRPILSSKLGDLEDVNGSAPDTTGDLLTWNNTSGVWERNSYNITDYYTKTEADNRYVNLTGDTMTGDLHLDGDFTNYNSLLLDRGAIQTSDKRGYGDNYVSNKIIANSKIGRSGLEEDGGIRIRTQADGIVRVELYLEGAWKTILSGVNIVTDSEERPKDIEFTDFTPWNLSLVTGDSDLKDINGLPLVQQMTSSIGAIQRAQTINGGTF